MEAEEEEVRSGGGGCQGWGPSSSFCFSPLYPKSPWILLPLPTVVLVFALFYVHSGYLLSLSLSLSILLFFSHISLPLGLSIPHWEWGVLWGADGFLRPGPWLLGVTPSLD